MTQRADSIFGKALLAVAFVAIGLCGSASLGQAGPSSLLLETGKVERSGKQMSFRIRNLPVSSFPDLPPVIAEALVQRGCLIPQSFQAHRPENVIHGSFEQAGSNDWAVLCSAENQVKLLVFFTGGASAEPAVLATFAKLDRLQTHDLTGEMGFNWAIDPASPKRVHDAQAGLTRRPPSPDHDAVAESTLDGKTIYRLYRSGSWEVVDTQ